MFFTTWKPCVDHVCMCAYNTCHETKKGSMFPPTLTPARLPVFPLHVDSYRWSLADTSCCLTFSSPPRLPGNDGVVCSLTLDLQEAVKPLSACHGDLAQPCLFLKAHFPKGSQARGSVGISMHIQSFIRGRWTNNLRSASREVSVSVNLVCRL